MDASSKQSYDIIFMDVESTGLGNSPLFLVGIMVWQDNAVAKAYAYLAREVERLW